MMQQKDWKPRRPRSEAASIKKTQIVALRKGEEAKK